LTKINIGLKRGGITCQKKNASSRQCQQWSAKIWPLFPGQEKKEWDRRQERQTNSQLQSDSDLDERQLSKEGQAGET
jgi:hypothetical protein